MYFDYVSLRIIKEYLMPLGSKGGSIIGILDSIVFQVFLEAVDIIGAESNVAPFDGVDMKAIPDSDIQIPFSQVHLHAAFSGKLDIAVVAGFAGCGCSWKVLWGDVIHLHDFGIEIM